MSFNHDCNKPEHLFGGALNQNKDAENTFFSYRRSLSALQLTLFCSRICAPYTVLTNSFTVLLLQIVSNF